MPSTNVVLLQGQSLHLSSAAQADSLLELQERMDRYYKDDVLPSLTESACLKLTEGLPAGCCSAPEMGSKTVWHDFEESRRVLPKQKDQSIQANGS